jgi:signal transduction histidine kinase
MSCLRVLLIDDDSAFLARTEETIAQEGYTVTAVTDFEKAAAILHRQKGKTVVLSGLKVGGKRGLSFLIETIRQFPHLPFTFLSTSPSLDSVIEALKQGAYDFLRKPVDPGILLHSVARSIEKLNLSLESEKHEKEANEQLSRLQADLKTARLQSAYKGFLISMTGHDFKSILTVLDGYFHILEGKCDDCKKLENVLLKEKTLRTLLRLKTMANTLLDYEAAETGQLRIEPKEFELKPVLEDCAAFYRPYAALKRVVISVEDNLPRLRPKGDLQRVLQILDNLIYNAIKFTPPEGEIRIGAQTDDDKSAITWIHDTGIGIPKSQFDKIFTESQIVAQNDGSARMGLGLNICKKLLELQNGKIWIESEPGKGTKVYFSLPM